MKQRLEGDRITLYFNEAEVREFDRPRANLIVGRDADKRIITITIVDPPSRRIASKYDAAADALSLNLSNGPFRESEEVLPDLVVDYDASRRIGALEFLNATRWFSADTLKELKSGRQVSLV